MKFAIPKQLDNFLAVSVYANRLLLWVQICDATGCFVKALPMGQNIVLDKSYTKQLEQIDFRNLKSTKHKNNKFLKYKISICLDQTYEVFIVLRVP